MVNATKPSARREPNGQLLRHGPALNAHCDQIEVPRKRCQNNNRRHGTTPAKQTHTTDAQRPRENTHNERTPSPDTVPLETRYQNNSTVHYTRINTHAYTAPFRAPGKTPTSLKRIVGATTRHKNTRDTERPRA